MRKGTPLRGEANDDDRALGRGGESARSHESASRFSWRAIVIGIVMTFVSSALFAALGGVLLLSGVAADLMRSDGARLLVVFAVLSLVVSFAFGSWFAVRKVAPHSPAFVGPIIAGAVIACSVALGTPFVKQMADYHSVAIALGLVDAPDVGTRASEALHRLVTAGRDTVDPADGDVLSEAWTHVRKTLWYVAAVLVTLIAAASLGTALGKQEIGSSRIGSRMRRLATLALAALASGTGMLTILLWPSTWAVYVALLDFDQSAGPEIGVSLSEAAPSRGDVG